MVSGTAQSLERSWLTVLSQYATNRSAATATDRARRPRSRRSWHRPKCHRPRAARQMASRDFPKKRCPFREARRDRAARMAVRGQSAARELVLAELFDSSQRRFVRRQRWQTEAVPDALFSSNIRLFLLGLLCRAAKDLRPPRLCTRVPLASPSRPPHGNFPRGGREHQKGPCEQLFASPSGMKKPR